MYTPGQWYEYFYMKERNQKQSLYYNEVRAHISSMFSYILKSDQINGRILNFLSVPNSCGKISKERLKKIYLKERNTRMRSKLNVKTVLSNKTVERRQLAGELKKVSFNAEVECFKYVVPSSLSISFNSFVNQPDDDSTDDDNDFDTGLLSPIVDDSCDEHEIEKSSFNSGQLPRLCLDSTPIERKIETNESTDVVIWKPSSQISDNVPGTSGNVPSESWNRCQELIPWSPVPYGSLTFSEFGFNDDRSSQNSVATEIIASSFAVDLSKPGAFHKLAEEYDKFLDALKVRRKPSSSKAIEYANSDTNDVSVNSTNSKGSVCDLDIMNRNIITIESPEPFCDSKRFQPNSSDSFYSALTRLNCNVNESFFMDEIADDLKLSQVVDLQEQETNVESSWSLNRNTTNTSINYDTIRIEPPSTILKTRNSADDNCLNSSVVDDSSQNGTSTRKRVRSIDCPVTRDKENAGKLYFSDEFVVPASIESSRQPKTMVSVVRSGIVVRPVKELERIAHHDFLILSE